MQAGGRCEYEADVTKMPMLTPHSMLSAMRPKCSRNVVVIHFCRRSRRRPFLYLLVSEWKFPLAMVIITPQDTAGPSDVPVRSKRVISLRSIVDK